MCGIIPWPFFPVNRTCTPEVYTMSSISPSYFKHISSQFSPQPSSYKYSGKLTSKRLSCTLADMYHNWLRLPGCAWVTLTWEIRFLIYIQWKSAAPSQQANLSVGQYTTYIPQAKLLLGISRRTEHAPGIKAFRRTSQKEPSNKTTEKQFQ